MGWKYIVILNDVTLRLVRLKLKRNGRINQIVLKRNNYKKKNYEFVIEYLHTHTHKIINRICINYRHLG